MAERCAVIGVGQTKLDAKRIDVSQVGLVREAALRALDDAGIGFADIDAVVIGKAPDLFEGVMMPELFLADALGGAGKPMLRVHTAGSVGGSTAVVAASLVEAGVHERVLTVAYEKQSESNAMWALSIRRPADPLLHPPLGRARGHRDPRGAQGPHERAQEPLCASAHRGHLLRPDRELADALGSDPLPRDLPVLRRGLRDGARERAHGAARAAATRLGPRHRHAHRAHAVRRARPGEPAGRDRLRAGALR
jgi:hypothetical protein